MKIAIIHDWLNVKIGGAEAVFFELARLYPEADLYALICDYQKFGIFLSGRPVYTSRLQNYPTFLKTQPKLLLPFIKKAITKIDLSGYDVVISSSSAWVKNVKIGKNTKHLCYCHSPARMLWDSWPHYLEGQTIGRFKLGSVSKFFITKLVSRLRLWDYQASSNVDEFVANSKYIARRIKKYYRRTSTVIYPPVKTSLFNDQYKTTKQDFYLILSVLSDYKNIDLAIEAFKLNHKTLVIAGDGPARSRLRVLAGGAANISFIGRVSESRKAELLRQARALIFPGLEDFGITPVEAMAAGTPVIAFRGGGVCETVVDKKTGLFFDQLEAVSLNSTLEQAETISFDHQALLKQAKKFDQDVFAHNIQKQVERLAKKDV